MGHYQITRSVIHDLDRDSHLDNDSCVGGIPNLAAAADMFAQIVGTYVIEGNVPDFSATTNILVPYAVTFEVFDPTRPRTVTFEVQSVIERTDPTRILGDLDSAARPTNHNSLAMRGVSLRKEV